MKTKLSIVVLAAVIVSWHGAIWGAEYFVSKQGSDANLGVTMATPFLTIQKGVDSLQAGDTLSIAPGEYSGTVKLANFGDVNKQTLIRAQIRGSVVLRGTAMLT